MEEPAPLTAKSFVKGSETREKYECGICFEVCVKPVRCKGSCERVFCMRCVSDARQNLDKCPNRCSQPFLVTPIANLELEFHCPYNPELCTVPILGLDSFEDHYKQCSFVPPEALRLKKL